MEKPTVIALSLPQEALDKMKSFYREDLLPPSNPYVYFAASSCGVTITAYAKEKQGLHKVVFQGEEALHEAEIWGYVQETLEESKPKARVSYPQIGSDEVGTGDFFGPVIVVSCYVEKKDLALLKELGVADSKMLSDEKILEIGPVLIKSLDYSQLCLPNEKYNEVVEGGLNMNAIKAKMHNRCLLNLSLRYPKAQCYQDQFAEPGVYFSYLKKDKEVLRDIVFATKGESKFVSVAASSVIARYSFLRHMEELGKPYRTTFPFGAGPLVDQFARHFVDMHGKEELRKVAKLNFANMRKI